MSELVTGEAVAVDLRPAQLGSRLVATMIDLVVQSAVLLVLIMVLSASDLSVDPALASAIIGVVVLGVFVGYPVLFETLWHGRTLGKAAMGLRVVRDDGGPIRVRQSLVRALLWCFADGLVTSGAGGIIASLSNRRGKRLGDLAAGTFVLQERVPVRRQMIVPMPAPLAMWAQTLDLSRLPDDLALAVRDFLGRSHELAPAARDRLGAQLTAAVTAVVSPPPPYGTPGWAYLSAVVAERRRRDEVRLQAQAGAQWQRAAAAQAQQWSPPPAPPPAREPEPPASDAPDSPFAPPG